MNREQALSKMVPPSQKRPSAWKQGIIQIWITRACDRSCCYCTQGSNLKHGPRDVMFITVENYEKAVVSLKDYFGVVGMFGGNPAIHPKFEQLCEILKKHIPYSRRGIWCNHPLGAATIMKDTFNPRHSNLNVHGNYEAYKEFKKYWPESKPVGLKPSMHSPVYGTPPTPEEERWSHISRCDINQYWSAMIGQFRGEARAWFCEIAGSQAMLNQLDPTYPDTGLEVSENWWKGSMQDFAHQVDQHCLNCLVPYRCEGLLDNSYQAERTTKEYFNIYIPKREKPVEIIENFTELKPASLKLTTDYIGNAQ